MGGVKEQRNLRDGTKRAQYPGSGREHLPGY